MWISYVPERIRTDYHLKTYVEYILKLTRLLSYSRSYGYSYLFFVPLKSNMLDSEEFIISHTDLALCIPLNINRRFGGTYRSHRQG
jgi:hypothetical protein